MGKWNVFRNMQGNRGHENIGDRREMDWKEGEEESIMTRIDACNESKRVSTYVQLKVATASS